jgi:hypothetical protein
LRLVEIKELEHMQGAAGRNNTRQVVDILEEEFYTMTSCFIIEEDQFW